MDLALSLDFAMIWLRGATEYIPADFNIIIYAITWLVISLC